MPGGFRLQVTGDGGGGGGVVGIAGSGFRAGLQVAREKVVVSTSLVICLPSAEVNYSPPPPPPPPLALSFQTKNDAVAFGSQHQFLRGGGVPFGSSPKL